MILVFDVTSRESGMKFEKLFILWDRPWNHRPCPQQLIESLKRHDMINEFPRAWVNWGLRWGELRSLSVPRVSRRGQQKHRHRSGDWLNIKTLFAGIDIPIAKIRWLWGCLIVIMGIPILASWHLYTEQPHGDHFQNINELLNVNGILPKWPYPPCLCMADRALLAGYPRCKNSYYWTSV